MKVWILSKGGGGGQPQIQTFYNVFLVMVIVVLVKGGTQSPILLCRPRTKSLDLGLTPSPPPLDKIHTLLFFNEDLLN